MRTQLFRSLIHRETRQVGRYLKEDAAWLAEVDRVEVGTIQYRSHIQANISDLAPPFQLLIVVRGPPGNMVYSSYRFDTTLLSWYSEHINQRRMARIPHFIAGTIALLSDCTKT